MISRGLGLACCLSTLAYIAAACGTPPPDSVTIPRSNTVARSAASSEGQPNSGTAAGEGVAVDISEQSGRTVVDSASGPSTNLPILHETLEPAEPAREIAVELSSPETVEASNTSSYSRVAEVAAGQFFTAHPSHPTSGSMKIVEISGQAVVELADDFRTADGSNLQLVAFRDAVVPQQIDGNDYVHIAELLAYRGASRYPVPQDMNLNEFEAIAIWCEESNTVFGYASL
ncbi:MAG: DM13 domain-containing protein [Synechococcus sp.]